MVLTDINGNFIDFLQEKTKAAAVIPNDAIDLPNPGVLYVGTSGDIVVTPSGSAGAVTYKSVPAGTKLNIIAKRVHLTGATATDLIVEY